MFPFIYEWAWDMSHMVFMGGLYYALGIIGAGLTFVFLKSLVDTFQGKGPGEGHH
ncbi:MAG: hypothetical protein JRI97_04470 [Deltaproteobacteria bacterium]|nr:hypothetical protein [Deltaproteobacteria bacterium]